MRLLTANALDGQVADVARLAGSALGGILAAVGGIVAVTLIDAASFVASAALLGLVRTSGRTTARGPAGESARVKLAAVGTELRNGLRLSTRHKVLRALMISALVTSVGEGIMSTLFTPFVEHVLHGDPQDLGFIIAAQAVGGIVGGMFAAASGGRLRASRLLSYGAIVFGLIDLAIQGGGYVVAGLVMLIWLADTTEPSAAVAGDEQAGGLDGERLGQASLARGNTSP